MKTSTKEFCATIATNIARYEKYRCWASKLPCQGVGAKTFGMAFEDQESQTFWRDIPGFSAGISRGCPKSRSQKKEKIVFNVWHLSE